ncbi:MAG TPA: hypothetical protein VGG84_00525 [Gemmatimonadaceae bacterium]|jgi:hypothetical protein
MRISATARAALSLFVIGSAASPLHAQTPEHTAAATVPTLAAPSAEAQTAFALIKSLSGRWQGTLLDPRTQRPVTLEASLHVTSRGNAVVHEMTGAGAADDPSKNDHPVTMMYIDGASLLLTHYCDAGNRPRMAARVSPDRKQVDFDFLDVSGPTTHGHMQHVRFTFVDSTHHAEEWTWGLPNGKTMGAEMQLHRVESVAALPAK